MGTIMQTTKGERSRVRVGFLLAMGLLCISTARAQQPATSAPIPQASIPAEQAAATPAQPPPATGGQAQESEAPQVLHLLVGRSLIITSPTRIKRVSLADPAIAEDVVVSPTQVLVNGKAPGGVSLIIWDEAGQSQSFEVSVDIDVLGLTQKIHEVFPAEPVQVETSKDVVMLSGRVSSAAVADKILEVVKNSTPKVTSLMEVPTPPQAEVSLHVRFAEVSRQVNQSLGANFIRTFGSNMPMAVTTGQFSPPVLTSLSTVTTNGSTTTTSTSGQNSFLLGSLLNIFIDRPDIDLATTIQALEARNLLQILAEPTLLAESGTPASFLAGGQYPYPVVQSLGTGGVTPVTIQFKEYGVRLSFTPTVTENGLIHLKLVPEVSTLDYTNAVTISGFTIPGVATQRVESEMDLKDGQSFAIAGLLDNRAIESLDKIPWIGDIPILGKLFQSRSLTKSDNELLVVVTPHIVRPLAPNEVPPGPTYPLPFLRPITPPGQTPQPK